MSAELELNVALSAYAPLTSIVDDRIYPDFLAQELELPAIVYQRAATNYELTIHSGVVLDRLVTIEVWCLHSTRIGAEEVADEVEDAIAAAVNSFRPLDRRPEFDPETLTYSTVVTCSVWPV